MMKFRQCRKTSSSYEANILFDKVPLVQKDK